jgi:hypothetical protein
MDDRTLHELIELEAYAIWQWRMSWTLPFEGTQLGDWLNAEKNVLSRKKEEVLSLSVANRLEKYL